jgi:mannose-6-phosphate isomerase-like protein (cupin superfamily)
LPSLPRASIVAHDGVGRIEAVRALADADFETNLQFVDYAELPPGSAIGVHRHGDDEELYFIIEGEGLMTVDGHQHRVRAGDLILNARHGEHGLRNDTTVPIRLLVWQVRG